MLLWLLQLQADVRTIISRTFATQHSLRFPRVTRIRWDKSPLDVQTDDELWGIVNEQRSGVPGICFDPAVLAIDATSEIRCGQSSVSANK